MTLYLSRLILDRHAPTRAIAPLIDPADASAAAAAHHRLIWTLFGDGRDRARDFLWRAEPGGRFYTLSARPPRANALFSPPSVKTFEPDLAPGDRLEFSLRANATRDRARATKDRRVDLVMDLLHETPKVDRAAQRPEAAQKAAEDWMTRIGSTRGFAPERTIADRYDTISVGRSRRSGATFGILDLAGVITVTEPGVFLHALAAGFGRAKAWGCGLMMIRRAR